MPAARSLRQPDPKPRPVRSSLPPRHTAPTSLTTRRRGLHRGSQGLTRTAAEPARTGRSPWPRSPRHCCLGCCHPGWKVPKPDPMAVPPDRNRPHGRMLPRFAQILAGLARTACSPWRRCPRHCCFGCCRPGWKVPKPDPMAAPPEQNCPQDRAARRFAGTLAGLARTGRWPWRLRPGHCRFACCCSQRPPTRLLPAAAKGPARAMSGLGRYPGSVRPPTDQPGHGIGGGCRIGRAAGLNAVAIGGLLLPAADPSGGPQR